MQHPCQLDPFQVIAMQLLDLFRQAAAEEGLYVGIVRNASIFWTRPGQSSLAWWQCVLRASSLML
jgi:hypothetical protein